MSVAASTPGGLCGTTVSYDDADRENEALKAIADGGKSGVGQPWATSVGRDVAMSRSATVCSSRVIAPTAVFASR